MKKICYTFLSCIVVVQLSCKKDHNNDPEPTAAGEVQAAPDGFTFNTSKKVDVSIRLLTNANTPLKNVVVKILQPGKTPADGLFLKTASDANGYVKGTVVVPAYLDTLLVQPDYPGLNNRMRGLITQNTLTGSIGGSEGFSGNIVADATVKPGATTDPARVLTVDLLTGIDFQYPSPYTTTSTAVKSPTSTGVPKYLESTRDNISQTFLDNVAATFPDGSSTNVAAAHPELLTQTVTSINIAQAGYLYVGFLSEGSSFQSALGYYTYNSNNAPTSIGNVNNVTLVFPNASGNGSGGGLVSGDKVKIGPFAAGTTVGFVLVQDAWTGSGVSIGNAKFFTTPAINPESATALKRHAIMLYDSNTSSFVFGFEDLNRQSSLLNPGFLASDNDFNDLLIYVTGDAGVPSTAGVSQLATYIDSDGDGVADAADEFPNDAARAYTETTTWSTLAFEDLWPNTGDYDMNDLVVQYRYRNVKNTAGNIVEFYGDYKVMAAGAVYDNGFGVEFPFSPNLVKAVTGQQLTQTGFITLAANGVEGGQAKAVIIPFDNCRSVISNPSSSPQINTNPGLPKADGTVVSVKIEFTSPQTPSTVGTAPFNPFLIENKQRGYEIHLPGMATTTKGNQSLFGTGNDRSNVATGKYFQTGSNWPWAINIAGTFAYPIEGAAINSAYLHFLDWAQSGGASYTDWYSNTGTGYRNTSLIYSK